MDKKKAQKKYKHKLLKTMMKLIIMTMKKTKKIFHIKITLEVDVKMLIFGVNSFKKRINIKKLVVNQLIYGLVIMQKNLKENHQQVLDVRLIIYGQKR
jgi:hypothetical protein